MVLRSLIRDANLVGIGSDVACNVPRARGG